MQEATSSNDMSQYPLVICSHVSDPLYSACSISKTLELYAQPLHMYLETFQDVLLGCLAYL